MLLPVQLLIAMGLLAANAVLAQVQLGNEVLAQNGFKILQGKRVALITNPSGVNRRLKSTIEVLRQGEGVKLVALFAPEHGLHGDIPAGKEFTNAMDRGTGLPVYSLYGPGPTRKPTARMLNGIDAVVYDIQDTGCRSYTFISTMGLAMEACAEAGVEFIVLDRPNPLGGERIEGPMVKNAFRSFVSQWDIPYVYGMTCGELARMINGERWIRKPCKLSIVAMSGWHRWMVWRDTGLVWIPTSPYVRYGDGPMFQVATGILGEIGGVNIGMSTDNPFQCIAAPWLDAGKICQWLNEQRLHGLKFQPIAFKSPKSAFTNYGARILITEPRLAPLTAINFYALEAVKKTSGRDLFVAAVRGKRSFTMFDKVNGTDATRRALQAGKSAASLVEAWKAGEEAFRTRRQKYLLY